MEWLGEWFADDPERGRNVLLVIVLAIATAIIWFGRKQLVGAILVTLVFLLLAAIGIPGAIPARPAAYRNACIANLKMIRDAKNQWAEAHNKQASEIPTEADLLGTNGLAGFLRDYPTCPRGGTYTIGPVGKNPTCSLSDKGHRLE